MTQTLDKLLSVLDLIIENARPEHLHVTFAQYQTLLASGKMDQHGCYRGKEVLVTVQD